MRRRRPRQGHQVNHEIPAGPIVGAVRERLVELAAQGHPNPRFRLVQEIWPDATFDSGDRRLRAMAHQERCTFDLADRILTGIGRTHLWHEDPVLRDAYQATNLARIDGRKPT